MRKDRLGNLIIKNAAGAKKHKVTFIDSVECMPLAKIYVVESYKKFNTV
jgi:hypothetical protein